MKLQNKELILFDLDGTLIDSALDLAQAVNYMLETIGRDTFEESTIRNWVGNGAATLVKRGLAGQRDIENITFEQYLHLLLWTKSINKKRIINNAFNT